jgi:hypothetical protein
MLNYSYIYIPQEDGTSIQKILKTENGKNSVIPINEGNRHYKEVLQWVADGNTIGE